MTITHDNYAVDCSKLGGNVRKLNPKI